MLPFNKNAVLYNISNNMHSAWLYQLPRKYKSPRKERPCLGEGLQRVAFLRSTILAKC